MKIKCPQCDFENEEGNKFCSKCNIVLIKSDASDIKENPYIKIKNGNINAKQVKNIFKLRVNKKISRKVILGIFVPVFMFFIFYAIAYYIGGDTQIIENSSRDISRHFGSYSRTIGYVRTYHYPFNWQKTWLIWIIYLIFFSVFEYILLKDKEIYITKLGSILKRIFKI